MTSLKINTIEADAILYIASNIYPIYSYPVSAIGAIGYTFKLTPTAGVTIGSATKIVNAQIIPEGTWCITGSFRVVVTNTTNGNILSTVNRFSGVSTTIGASSLTVYPSTQTQYYQTVSFIFQADGVATLTIDATAIVTVGSFTFNTGTSNSTFHIYATKIG